MQKNFQAVKVQCGKLHKPLAVEINTVKVRVEAILESWYDTGSWWEGESEKIFYRISCQDGGLREIFHDLSSGEWFLYRVYD